MRICIDMGHTPTSPGASGYLDELSNDRELGKRVIAELKARGHVVYNSTPADNVGGDEEIDSRVRYANSKDIDLFVSIHLNAGGGTGTEVLYFDGDATGKKYASRISEKLSKALKLPDRGAKANNWVGVICNTNCTAVLIECCFVDRREDYEAWCVCPWNDMVVAICDGIDGTNHEAPTVVETPVESKPSVEPSRSEIRYAVSNDPNGKYWLPDMIGWKDTGGSSDNYAGNGSAIRWIAIDCPKGYQVKTDNGWLDKVYKMDKNDLVNGCAGDGTPIHAIRIFDSSLQYAVANVGCSFLPNMVGIHDTGGSSDDFAGNGGIISKIRIKRV